VGLLSGAIDPDIPIHFVSREEQEGSRQKSATCQGGGETFWKVRTLKGDSEEAEKEKESKSKRWWHDIL
jgi:hypothetical protein